MNELNHMHMYDHVCTHMYAFCIFLHTLYSRCLSNIMSPGDFTGKHHELQIFIELAMDRGPSAPLPSQAPGDSQWHPTSTAVVFRTSWSQSLAAEAIPNP